MDKLVTVVIPIYKVEKYLNRCIESVVKQTYKNLEIILVDDGSPDRCPQMCEEWKQKDSRIKVIHRENGGLAAARNSGINVAQGQYIAFVDSDDYMHPEYIEILYHIMKEENADLVACDHQEVGAEEIISMPKIGINGIKKKHLEEVTPVTIGITAWNKLYKKQLFDEVRYPEGKIHEDAGVWWRIVYRTKHIAAVSNVLYYYCVNMDSIMRKEFSMKHMDLIDVLYDEYEEFKTIDKNIAAEIMEKCMNSFVAIYKGLVESRNWTEENKKVFLKEYREKLQEYVKIKGISSKNKIKHMLYCWYPKAIRIKR